MFILAILPMKGGSSMSSYEGGKPGTRCQQTGSQNPYYSDHAVSDLYCDDGVRGNFAPDGRNASAFDTICHLFASTAGTGGFGIKNDSFESYSRYLQSAVADFHDAVWCKF